MNYQTIFQMLAILSMVTLDLIYHSGHPLHPLSNQRALKTGEDLKITVSLLAKPQLIGRVYHVALLFENENCPIKKTKPIKKIYAIDTKEDPPAASPRCVRRTEIHYGLRSKPNQIVIFNNYVEDEDDPKLKKIQIGTITDGTDYMKVIDKYLTSDDVRQKWLQMSSYNLITNNCFNFTETLVDYLFKADILSAQLTNKHHAYDSAKDLRTNKLFQKAQSLRQTTPVQAAALLRRWTRPVFPF